MNALNDIVEEWLRNVDSVLIHEANESQAREKRLRKEYDDLRRQHHQQFQTQYKVSMARKDDDGWESSGGVSRSVPNGVRLSRRLRGEQPDLDLKDVKDLHRRTRKSSEHVAQTQQELPLELIGMEPAIPEEEMLPVAEEDAEALVAPEMATAEVGEEQQMVEQAIESVENDAMNHVEEELEDASENEELQLSVETETAESLEEEPATSAVSEENSSAEKDGVIPVGSYDESAAETALEEVPKEVQDLDGDSSQNEELMGETTVHEIQSKDVVPVPNEPVELSSEPVLLTGAFQLSEEEKHKLLRKMVDVSTAFSLEQLEAARTTILRQMYIWRQALLKMANQVVEHQVEQQSGKESIQVPAEAEAVDDMEVVPVAVDIPNLYQTLSHAVDNIQAMQL